MITEVISSTPMKRPKRLSATFVNTVNVPGRYGDGRGGHSLSLLVKEASTGGFSKSSAQRIRLDGNAANVGLGAYPVGTLARARQKALANARTVSEGRDPRDRTSRAPTFEQAVEKVIGIHADTGRTAASPPPSGAPASGTMPYRRSARSAWTASAPPTSWRCCCRSGHEAGNREARPTAHRRGHEVGSRAGLPRGQPAGDAISAALPKNTVRRQHQRALPHAQVAEALGGCARRRRTGRRRSPSSSSC